MVIQDEKSSVSILLHVKKLSNEKNIQIIQVLLHEFIYYNFPSFIFFDI